MPKFCHELDDFPELCRVISDKQNILPQLVEKDYWIMHCLYGLEKLGFEFEMKGGTSLSKGWGLLERFSEDIDLQINPPSTLPIGKNHRKSRHIKQRKAFFDELAERIKIDGIIEIKRELTFDDDQMRNAGIYLKYLSHFSNIDGVKSGILLEIGFDQTAPNESKIISSWAFVKYLLFRWEGFAMSPPSGEVCRRNGGHEQRTSFLLFLLLQALAETLEKKYAKSQRFIFMIWEYEMPL